MSGAFEYVQLARLITSPINMLYAIIINTDCETGQSVHSGDDKQLITSKRS